MSSIQSVSVDQAGGVTAELIPAVTGMRLEVLGFCLAVGGAALTVKSTLQDTTSNVVRMTLVGNATAPVIWPWPGQRENPAWVGGLNEGLELVTGAAAAVCGFIIFRYVK